MKKTLAILAMMSTATFLHAQGLVYMFGAEGIKTNTAVSSYAGGDQTGGAGGLAAAPSSGQSYYYALLVASSASAAPSLTASSLANTWSYSGITGNNYAAAGALTSPNGAAGAAANGWASGVTDWVVVVGWSASLGNSWATISQQLLNGNWAANGYFGVSGVGSVTAGGGQNPATAIWGGSGIQSGSLTMYSVSNVPEPTTIALIGLGGLGLAMIRRRK